MARIPEYELALGAARDMREIARYPAKTWGKEQAHRYREAFIAHLEALARREVRVKFPLSHRAEVQSSRCEHHYVISMTRDDEPLLILGILHENMDLPARLRERLEAAEHDG